VFSNEKNPISHRQGVIRSRGFSRIRGGQGAAQPKYLRRRPEIGEFGRGGLKAGNCGFGVECLEKSAAESCGRPCNAKRIACASIKLQSIARVLRRRMRTGRQACFDARAFQQAAPLVDRGCDGQGLLQERDGLFVGSQICRPIRGRLQGDSCLARQRVRLGTRGGIGVCRQVMAGEGAGELVRTERLEMRAAARCRVLRSTLARVL